MGGRKERREDVGGGLGEMGGRGGRGEGLGEVGGLRQVSMSSRGASAEGAEGRNLGHST